MSIPNSSPKTEKSSVRVGPPRSTVELIVWCMQNGIEMTPELEVAFESVDTTYRQALQEKNHIIERLEERLQEGLSDICTNTHLPRRITADDELYRAVVEERRGHGFAIVFLDLANLKILNDKLGHTAGDIALRGMAQLLINSIRPNDRAYRYGGDEFVVVLYELTGIRDAVSIVRRFMLAVEEKQWQWDHAGFGAYAPRIDVGVVYVELAGSKNGSSEPAYTEALAALMHAADQQMYKAKRYRQAGKGVIFHVDSVEIQGGMLHKKTSRRVRVGNPK